MTSCNPNTLGCATRLGANGPDFCGECGLARADYVSLPGQPQVSSVAPPTPPTPAQLRQPRPIVAMKPLSHDTSQQIPASAIPHTHPQATPNSPPSHSAISRVLLGSAPNAPTTPPKSVKRPPKRRRRNLVGLGAVAAFVAAAVVVTTQTEILQKLSRTSSSTQEVNGTVDIELLDLAGQNSAEIQLGSSSAEVSNGNFTIQGTAENTGLASLTSGVDLLGMNLVPKSSKLASYNVPISIESTAISLVLLRPEVSDVFVLGNPVLDAAAYEVLIESSELQSLVLELRTEAVSEGSVYLRELSPATEARITETTNWFRATVSDGAVDNGNLSARIKRNPRRESGISPRARVVGLPQTCDEGLMPSSFGEADGLCIEVTSPNREDWETYDFSQNMDIEIRNLSPRAAAVFLQDNGGPQTFLGLVPPLDLTLPSTSEILMKVFNKPTKIFNLAPDSVDLPEKELGSKFSLNGSTAKSVLTTVTFDWPLLPGIENPEFDQLVTSAGLESYRDLAFGLTSLSTYLLPVLGVVLDKAFKETSQGLGVLSSCPPSFIPKIAESAVSSTLGAGQDSIFDQLLNAEDGIPQLFWMVVLTRFTGSDCERAIANASIITGCWPSIRSFFDAILTTTDDIEGFNACFGDFRDEIFDRLVLGASRSVLKTIVSPIDKIDTSLMVLGILRSVAWQARDAKRFADGDQYQLTTVADVPRWCYEVTASVTRLTGVFGDVSLDTSGTVLETFREVIQGFLNVSTQLVELGGNLARESTWERETRAWEVIATIAPTEVRSDAETVAQFAQTISETIPNLKTVIRLSTQELLQGELGISETAQLAAALLSFERDAARVEELYEQLLPAFERIDTAYQSCPQSRRS